jgi:hypothetical protein
MTATVPHVALGIMQQPLRLLTLKENRRINIGGAWPTNLGAETFDLRPTPFPTSSPSPYRFPLLGVRGLPRKFFSTQIAVREFWRIF